MRSPVSELFRVLKPRTLRNDAPVPYVGRGQRIGFSSLFGGQQGAEAQMRAMGSVGTLFAIVNRTSTSTSAVKWHLWEKAESGLDEDRTMVTSHAALDTWNRWNRFYSRQHGVESGQQHTDLVGECRLVVVRDRRFRLPLEIWPVRPDRIEPIPHREKFLAGYVYHGPDGENVPLEVEDVLSMLMPNPLDPYRGMGPVQAILTDLDSVKYSAEWNRNFFLNSAEPGGIIEVTDRLSDDEFDEMSARWREQHQGVNNAHRVAIIEQGKWVDRKYTMRDMQFAELRGVSRDVIREAFGMPKFAVGDVEDVNRATADASANWFAEQLTVPRLDRWKGMLNTQFLPLYGATADGLEFDYESPVRADQEAEDRGRTSKADAASTLVGAGWHPDDVTDAMGLPRMRYAGQPAAVAPAPAPTSAAARRRARARVRAQADDQEEALQEVREDWEDRLDQLLDDWGPVASAQRAEIRAQVEQAVNDNDAEALAAITVTTTAGTALLLDAMVGQAEDGAQRMLDAAAEAGVEPPDVEVDAEPLSAAATAAAVLLGAALAMAAGREALRLLTPDADGGEVAGQVDEFLRGLSDRPLRDQLGGALWQAEGHGRAEALRELPEPDHFVASEVRDRNTCPPCEEIDGERFDTLADALAHYPTGGYRACEGGIRCRGTFEPVWD